MMVKNIETENEQYINRYKHVLNGYIENEDGIDQDNIKLLQDTKGEFLKEDANDIEIDMEQLTIVNKTKNCLIKFFNILLPFKGDIKYIKQNYNTTVLLTFRIYRFFFLMSIFTTVIFLPLLILHILKVKKNLGAICKYNFPCFLLYSSFKDSEALNMSVTYGVWIMFYFICSMIYYFLLNSENNQQEIYYQNNKNYSGSSYLFSSWNFNYKNEKISEKNKKAIQKELELYAEKGIDQIEGKKEQKCSWCFMIVTNIVYIVFLVFTFFLIIIFFYLRDKMRNHSKPITKLGAKDILADIVTYILIGAFLFLIFWISGFFPKFERWPNERQKHTSEGIKQLITSIISIISLIFIISYFTIYSNNTKKVIPFLKDGKSSFFGCPGKYNDYSYVNIVANNLENNYKKIGRKFYSQCREEEIGINFLFIFVVYFILLFLAEFLKSIINCFCLCMESPTFRPALDIIKFFTANVLFIMVIFYIPFFAILFPLIILALYKFQLFILKRRGSFAFKESGMYHRNNKYLLLNTFVAFNIAIFCIFGYFYFAPLPHTYVSDCYSPKTVDDNQYSYNVLITFKENWCGPVKSRIKLSSVLTDKMKDILILGWIVGLFQQLPFIIIIISIFFIALIYRKYNPDKRYYEYIIKRQEDLINTFYVLYEQISKRDILTSMLLKISQQKFKSK